MLLIVLLCKPTSSLILCMISSLACMTFFVHDIARPKLGVYKMHTDVRSNYFVATIPFHQ